MPPKLPTLTKSTTPAEARDFCEQFEELCAGAKEKPNRVKAFYGLVEQALKQCKVIENPAARWEVVVSCLSESEIAIHHDRCRMMCTGHFDSEECHEVIKNTFEELDIALVSGRECG